LFSFCALEPELSGQGVAVGVGVGVRVGHGGGVFCSFCTLELVAGSHGLQGAAVSSPCALEVPGVSHGLQGAVVSPPCALKVLGVSHGLQLFSFCALEPELPGHGVGFGVGVGHGGGVFCSSCTLEPKLSMQGVGVGVGHGGGVWCSSCTLEPALPGHGAAVGVGATGVAFTSPGLLRASAAKTKTPASAMIEIHWSGKRHGFCTIMFQTPDCELAGTCCATGIIYGRHARPPVSSNNR
jgi:hypothetical protein